MDPRVKKLAGNLIRFSTRVQPGDNVLIQARNETDDLVRAALSHSGHSTGRFHEHGRI